jgi:hypothetical protein
MPYRLFMKAIKAIFRLEVPPKDLNASPDPFPLKKIRSLVKGCLKCVWRFLKALEMRSRSDRQLQTRNTFGVTFEEIYEAITKTPTRLLGY